MSLILEYHISETVNALKKGKIVKFPSDTIWGLACSLSAKDSIRQLAGIKQLSEPTIHEFLVCDEFMLRRFVQKIHPRVNTLLHYYQRPLTVVYNDTMNLHGNLLPEQDKIGIRIARNQFCEAVIHDLSEALYFLPLSEIDENVPGSKHSALVGHEVPGDCYDPVERRASRVVSYDQSGHLIFHD